MGSDPQGLTQHGGGYLANARNTTSGEEVLWREGETRPSHTSVAVARLKAMIGSSRQPLAPFSSTAIRATSLLNSVTYMERSAANGRPSIGRSKATSSRWRSWSALTMVTVAEPPRSKARVKARDFGSKATSLNLTMGRPSTSTGPIRNEEPNAVGANLAGASGRRRQ